MKTSGWFLRQWEQLHWVIILFAKMFFHNRTYEPFKINNKGLIDVKYAYALCNKNKMQVLEVLTKYQNNVNPKMLMYKFICYECWSLFSIYTYHMYAIQWHINSNAIKLVFSTRLNTPTFLSAKRKRKKCT